MVSEAVVALNEMYGFYGNVGATGGKATSAQQLALENIRDAAARFGAPPPDLSGPGALRELRVETTYGGDSTTVAPVTFTSVNRLALPSGGSAPIDLETLAGDSGREISHRLAEMCFSREQGLERIRSHGPKSVYLDPNLNSPRLYRMVLEKLA